jgi:hypothetical protein
MFRAPTLQDLLDSKTATAMPSEDILPSTATRNYFQAIDNMIKVFAVRPGDNMLFLTDPLLDRRIVDAIAGVAQSRGVQPREFMAPSTQILECPEEAKPLIEKATFVVSTWFCSAWHPYCIGLRRKLGQRWVKITFFRNIDLWNTPQARFPVEIVGDIVGSAAPAEEWDAEHGRLQHGERPASKRRPAARR